MGFDEPSDQRSPEHAVTAGVVPVDRSALALAERDARYRQALFSSVDGGPFRASFIRTPPGDGSPEGRHVHDVTQVFFILAGTMSLEIDGEALTAPAHSLVVVPANAPHRNWNEGAEPTEHLSIYVPAPTGPAARRVAERSA